MSNNNDNKTNFLGDFLARNAWAIILVTVSVVAQWAVFGVRLENIEERTKSSEEAIVNLQASTNAYAVSIAEIQRDIQYIRLKLDRIIP